MRTRGGGEDLENPQQRAKLGKENPHEIGQDTREKPKDDGPQTRDGKEGGEQEGNKKKDVLPAIHVNSPQSGSAYPKGGVMPIGFECEGNGEFSATFTIYDSKGKNVQVGDKAVKLDDAGKGHGRWDIPTDVLGAGRYELHVDGASGGVSAPIQKMQFEIIDEGKDQKPESAGGGQEGDADETVKGGGV